MWLGLTTTHRQKRIFSSTSTRHWADLLTVRSVAHLVVHGWNKWLDQLRDDSTRPTTTVSVAGKILEVVGSFNYLASKFWHSDMKICERRPTSTWISRCFGQRHLVLSISTATKIRLYNVYIRLEDSHAPGRGTHTWWWWSTEQSACFRCFDSGHRQGKTRPTGDLCQISAAIQWCNDATACAQLCDDDDTSD